MEYNAILSKISRVVWAVVWNFTNFYIAILLNLNMNKMLLQRSHIRAIVPIWKIQLFRLRLIHTINVQNSLCGTSQSNHKGIQSEGWPGRMTFWPRHTEHIHLVTIGEMCQLLNLSANGYDSTGILPIDMYHVKLSIYMFLQILRPIDKWHHRIRPNIDARWSNQIEPFHSLMICKRSALT